MTQEEKMFEVKFIIKDGKIATKMSSKNIAPQETVGLLEIAKQQILDGLKQSKQEIFKGVKHD